MTHAEAVATLATERYLLGEMTDGESDAFEAHYFECVECAGDVRTAAAMRDGARTAIVAPRRVRAGVSWLQSPLVPWALAASLAVAAVYEARGHVEDAAADALALSPVTLRPASRGRDPVVTISSDTPVVALAVDVPGPSTNGRLHYVLRSDDGVEVKAADVPAPPPGTPLLLLVPTRLLRPMRTYMLTLGDADGALTPAGYTFTVVAR